MTLEERHISFKYEDVESALLTFGKTLGLTFPGSKMTEIKSDDKNEGFYTLVFLADDGKSSVSMNIRSHLVLACLVRFCHKKSIPLPLRSNKTLFVENGSIKMKIVMHSDMPEQRI